MAEGTVRPDEVEVSEEFVSRIKGFIGGKILTNIRTIIDRWKYFFPDDYTRNDVKLRVIRALDILNERKQIKFPFGISKKNEDPESSLICTA